MAVLQEFMTHPGKSQEITALLTAEMYNCPASCFHLLTYFLHYFYFTLLLRLLYFTLLLHYFFTFTLLYFYTTFYFYFILLLHYFLHLLFTYFQCPVAIFFTHSPSESSRCFILSDETTENDQLLFNYAGQMARRRTSFRSRFISSVRRSRKMSGA
jgi:hypothetical protein